MPTESRSPVSRRKLGIFSIAAVIAALMLVVSGIRAREDSSAKLREWTDNQAIPPVAVIYPDPGFLAPRSTCRAGWRLIIARRSLHASTAI